MPFNLGAPEFLLMAVPLALLLILLRRPALRLPVGGVFFVIGLIVTVLGFFSVQDDESRKAALGAGRLLVEQMPAIQQSTQIARAQLVGGVAITALGIVFLVWSVVPRHLPANPTA